jgi:hypothetical protein
MADSSAVRPAAATPVALACLLGWSAGCLDDAPNQSLSRTEAAPQASVKVAPRPLYRPAGIGKATAALKSRIGASVGVLSIEIFPHRLLIQVSSGGDEAVAYEWTTEQLRGPLPVELRGSGTLANNLFPFSTVDLSGVPELVRTAAARIDPEHGEVTRILIRRNLPVDDHVVMRAYVSSPIKSGQVDADASGRPTDSGR